uniref:Uncharacterized protein n=1 Tax=Arundo donax TaxID=35708 RepID=A0A0A8ZL47_ARUDO
MKPFPTCQIGVCQLQST